MPGKPDDIPQDVWDAASAVYAQLTVDVGEWHDKVHIARAILAERERCAKLAEREGVYPELNVAGGGPEWYRHAQRIAAAIRKGGA